MAILPSDVVDYIDRRFPDAATYQAEGKPYDLDSASSGFLSGLLRILDQLDSSYLPVGSDLVSIEVARATTEERLEKWRLQGGSSGALKNVPGTRESTILLIRRIMESLPDQIIPQHISGLEFISDLDVRNDLRADIASIDDLLHEEQWKAAMVIAGSVTEALLLYTLLDMDQNEVHKAAKSQNVQRDIHEWHLPGYLQVALSLRVISQDCYEQARIGQNYRNLIHPGKERREGRKASRGAALSSAAGLHGVLEEMIARHSGNSGAP